ncbi:hypothetical protein BFP72_00205 [Reichenbachiella sp. 5M10]|uniref:hypothetical protein n=1 Tax=Reichenbachiella sp. 5M10 TaxID=1889772 RepID=UPI000C14D73A|nr:hypothetical protein [Reichenbachiella sp. 5M10]PIB33965.1 hypothetical protein BFP72_00205 [Reichenbachiella sp. 5M10]
MTIKTRKYIYWGISLLSLSVILMSIYYFLGGFQPFELASSSNNSYSIAGKYIQGKRMHVEEGRLFNDVRGLLQTKKLNGDLCMVDYRPDTLEDGEILRFIGVLLGDDISAIPSGYQVIELRSAKSYKAALTMHPLVMPNAHHVEEALRSKAATQGDSLQNLSLEVYYPDNSVLIEMFVNP